jgi:hypothetical protein
MTCGMRGSGEGGGSGGVDTSFEHADGYAAARNVPHTKIEPRHVKTTRRIRHWQGMGERNNRLILLGPEVGRPRIYAYTIEWPPCAVNVSKLQQPILHREKEKRRLVECQERVLSNITGLVGTSCTSSFSQRLSRCPNLPGGRHGSNIGR